MTHDDDDGLDWQLWMELTDEQQDAIVEREWNELQARLDAMTIRQQVASPRST